MVSALQKLSFQSNFPVQTEWQEEQSTELVCTIFFINRQLATGQLYWNKPKMSQFCALWATFTFWQKPLCLFNTSTQTCTYAHTLADTSQDTWHSNPRSLLGGPASFPDVAAMTYSRGWWSKKLMVIWAPCFSSLSGSTASKKQQCARSRLHPAVLSQPLLLLIASDSEQVTAQ